MKKLLFFIALALSVLIGGHFRALAFRAPAQARLPDFDKRGLQVPVPPALEADRQAALNELSREVPGLKVSLEGKLGAPKFVRSARGFLTGPNGEGIAVSPQTAAAIPASDPYRPVKAFLTEHAVLFGHGAEELDSARITREFVTAHNGMRTVVWQQEVDGIPVFERVLIGHITRRGELVNLSSQFLPRPGQAATKGMANRAQVVAVPPVSAARAVALAGANVGAVIPAGSVAALGAAEGGAEKRQQFSAPGLAGPSLAQLVWVPYSRSLLRLSWQVTLTSLARGEMFMLLVDVETGDVLLRRCLTEYISDATYNVYTSDSPSPFSPGHPTPNTAQPPLVSRVLVVTNAFNTNASPNGWINDTDNETSGNNVDAHLDRNADNQPDLPRPQGNPNRVFDFALDLTMDPTTYGDAATVQLFYLNNFIHDKLWELGFTEAAGNFQLNNFGRGGLGNDPVQADAQDGSGFNNANFATPPDGQSGRMQMYIFDGPTPNRDGDLDAEVVIHEYCHGLSNRRVGNGVGISAFQTRGMGEGWSDFCALSLLSEPGDDVDAVYASGGYASFQIGGLMENYYFGIRRYPYTTDLNKNPLTFKDIDPAQYGPHTGIPNNPVIGGPANEVHNQGEVWCVTLWEVRANLVKKFGFATGNPLALQLVIDGMNLSPPNPNFLEARDAIIAADLVDNGGANFDELWAAFAKRGMGGSASSPDSSTTAGVEEAFDLPGLALSKATATDPSGNGNGAVDFNECLDLNVVLVNNGRVVASGVNGILTTTNPLVTISQGSSAYPDVLPGATATNVTAFKFYTAPGFPCGAPIVFVLQLTSDQDSRSIRVIVNTGLIGGASRYDNNTVLAIPDANPVGVSSPVTVSGFSGNLAKVTVSLHILHTFDFDLDIRLVAPDGTSVILSQLNGFFGQNFGTACTPDSQRTTFDDKATTSISAGRPPYVGIFRPDEPLSSFTGKSGNGVNGVWRLQIADVFAQDTGTLECWSLNLSPFLCNNGGGDCSTDLRITKTDSPGLHVVGSNLVYTITVTNQGPNTARSVMVNDPLPAGLNFVSALATQGACGEVAGVVNCNLGTLAEGRSANVDITVIPMNLGRITNNATVTSTVSDPNPFDNTASVVSSIVPPSPVIVSAGTFLISESKVPNSGGIDAGEDVTIRFNLRNVGSLDTSNLVVKLQAGGGVVGPSAQQSYGVLAVDGPPVARDFSFTANGTNGGTITATLQLQDGTNNLGSLPFVYGLGSQFGYLNQSVLTLPDSGPANIYPSPIFVSGLFGLVDKVEITLSNLSHTFPEDLDFLLVGPTGKKVVVMSDAGGGNPVNRVTLTLDDEAASSLPFSSTLVSGTYKPTDYPPADLFPLPAPASPYESKLAAFHGTDPNGTWNLYAADDTAGDQGRLAGGWQLRITTVDPVNPIADLGIGLVASPDPVKAGQELTYTVTVTNRGPEEARDTIVTNALPLTADFVSASASQGSCSNGNGQVICFLGSLTNQAVAVMTVVVSPTQFGTINFNAAVGAQVIDFETRDNTATLATTVNAVADLEVGMEAAAGPLDVAAEYTYALSATNLGPNTAFGIFLTNVLPSGVTFVSATSSAGSCSQASGRVLCNLGNLNSGAGASVQVRIRPTSVSTITNRAYLHSQAPLDPNLNNNAIAATLNVINPLYHLVASGAALVAESFSPPSGGIDVGETVTVSLGLRNVGTANTANLSATLLESGGVVNSSGQQNYGVVTANGPAISRDFSFTATGTPGNVITAFLHLQDGATDLGTVSYPFALGAALSFLNSNPIAIPDVGKSEPYPSIITVSNLSGLVSKAVVTLHGVEHSYPDDLDILLEGPTGRHSLLMSDVGGGNGITNLTLTFDDDANQSLPDFLPLLSGIYRPTDFESGDLFPLPAPAGPYTASLRTFRDTDPTGDWALYVVDDSVGDLGQISGGWELSLTTYGPVASQPATLENPRMLPNGQFQFTLNGQNGSRYVIEASTDFMSWTPLSTNTLSGSSLLFTDGNAQSLDHRFYRARLAP